MSGCLRENDKQNDLVCEFSVFQHNDKVKALTVIDHLHNLGPGMRFGAHRRRERTGCNVCVCFSYWVFFFFCFGNVEQRSLVCSSLLQPRQG